MKKLFLSVCMLCLFAVLSNAQTPEVPSGVVIGFTTQIINPTSTNGGYPRGPVYPPEAMLSGHTLYIMTSHGDYDLQLLSSDGSVVYETFVPSTVNEVVLPSSLTGCLKLLLWAEPYVFIGEVNI